MVEQQRTPERGSSHRRRVSARVGRSWGAWLSGVCLALALPSACSGSAFSGLPASGVGGEAAGGAAAGGAAGRGDGGDAGSSGGGQAVGGASAGEGGAGQAGAEPGGGAGANSGGQGGSAGTGAGGDAEGGAAAGAAGTGAGGDCSEPLTWYPDQDGDGWGRSSGAQSACDPPDGTWVLAAGDCNDDNSLVHPEQLDYFEEPYTTGGGQGSFDYDCSEEEESPSAGAPMCSGLALANCAGSGYLPAASPTPSGNPICGSTTSVTCVKVGLLCQAMAANAPAAQCH